MITVLPLKLNIFFILHLFFKNYINKKHTIHNGVLIEHYSIIIINKLNTHEPVKQA